MSKKLIRLTESDLHKIIKESVEKVLQEGQGWDSFKYISKAKADDYEDGEFRKTARAAFGGDDIKNYIETGDSDRRQQGYYNPKDPLMGSDIYRDGNKLIDRSKMGQLGRAAGLGAGFGVLAAKRGLGKMGNAMKKGASAVGEKASEMTRNAKSQMMKNRINRQAKKYPNDKNGEYDSFTM